MIWWSERCYLLNSVYWAQFIIERTFSREASADCLSAGHRVPEALQFKGYLQFYSTRVWKAWLQSLNNASQFMFLISLWLHGCLSLFVWFFHGFPSFPQNALHSRAGTSKEISGWLFSRNFTSLVVMSWIAAMRDDSAHPRRGDNQPWILWKPNSYSQWKTHLISNIWCRQNHLQLPSTKMGRDRFWRGPIFECTV